MVKDYFCKSLEITKKIIEDDAFCLLIDYIANICIDAYRNDKKI